MRLEASNRKKLSVKIGSKEAVMVPLDNLIDHGSPCCVQLTANNRIPTWDLKHSGGASRLINSVDHLDVFRGTMAKQPTTALRFFKDWARDNLQRRGILR